MSRIHEALRRAEQEKTANHTAQKVEEPGEKVVGSLIEPEVAAPSNGAAMPTLQPVMVSKSFVAALPAALDFDEIWANCARPNLKPNSNLLVFSNSNPFHPGT